MTRKEFEEWLDHYTDWTPIQKKRATRVFLELSSGVKHVKFHDTRKFLAAFLRCPVLSEKQDKHLADMAYYNYNKPSYNANEYAGEYSYEGNWDMQGTFLNS